MAQTLAATASSSQATAFFRAFLYVTLTLALIPVQVVALLLRLPVSKRLPMWYHRVSCRILGIRLEVFGRRSRARPTLFVANHASYLDIAIYGALIPGSFVAKSEVAKWPLFGQWPWTRPRDCRYLTGPQPRRCRGHWSRRYRY